MIQQLINRIKEINQQPEVTRMFDLYADALGRVYDQRRGPDHDSVELWNGLFSAEVEVWDLLPDTIEGWRYHGSDNEGGCDYVAPDGTTVTVFLTCNGYEIAGPL